jgi:hypothetical protein
VADVQVAVGLGRKARLIAAWRPLARSSRTICRMKSFLSALGPADGADAGYGVGGWPALRDIGSGRPEVKKEV